MRFGVNTFVWESPFSTEELSSVQRAAALGFEVFEVACEFPDLIDAAILKRALQTHGLTPVVCAVLGPGRDLSHDDAAVRASTRAYLKNCIDLAAELESPTVCGPLYGSVGKSRLVSPEKRAEERDLSAAALAELGAYAGERGVRVALELLNRFETDMLNVVSQGLSFLDQVGSPHVGLHLDTFHMHLEEKNTGDAVRAASNRLFHLHACENDRGVPGTGQVDWRGFAGAVKDVNYQGDIVIESFTPRVTSIAEAVRIWRRVAPNQDAIARDGLAFLKGLLEA